MEPLVMMVDFSPGKRPSASQLLRRFMRVLNFDDEEELLRAIDRHISEVKPQVPQPTMLSKPKPASALELHQTPEDSQPTPAELRATEEIRKRKGQLKRMADEEGEDEPQQKRMKK